MDVSSEIMTENKPVLKPTRRLYAWLIHLLTASAAVFGLFTLYATYQGEYITAFWFMAAAILIDSVDGTLARFFKVKIFASRIDGALLDNIVDYLNYVITPAFFLLVSDILPYHWKTIGTSIIVLVSAYQFSQADAKTSDHFFKGFPSYWNIVVFYLFLAEANPWINLAIIVFLAVMVFIPIKYLYLTRLDHVTSHLKLKILLIFSAILWGICCVGLLLTYPNLHPFFIYYSIFFGVLYSILSLYRTFKPMQ